MREVPLPKIQGKNVLYVGRLDREKHVYVLLEAFAKLPSSLGLNLRVVGTGSQEAELHRLADDLSIGSRVEFVGDLSDAEVLSELGKSSVFVMPSLQEMQSMATLEAMAAGRPIIAAEAMALPGLVENGVNGYLFKPDSPSDLAAKLAYIFGLDEAEFDRLGRESRKKATANDLALTVANYERLYQGQEPVSVTPEGNGDHINELQRLRGLLANAVRSGAKRLGEGTSGVLERLDGVRGSVSETFSEVRFTIERRSKRATRKISSSLRKALDRIRSDD